MRAFRYIAVILLAATQADSLEAREERELLELRNTVVNLLQSLVERGVLTREDAESMIAKAQADAGAEINELAAEEPVLREDDVRVTYVPEIVREKIREEVSNEIRDEVVAEVKQAARAEGWGVPAALPDWIHGVELSGDIRVRAQGDFFAADNAVNTYLDFNDVNDAGGIDLAGQSGILNTTENRTRLGGRLRVGLAAEFGDHLRGGFRLVSGNVDSPVGTNQTFGDYFENWEIGVDQAYLGWHTRHEAGGPGLRQSLTAGRMGNPFGGVDELVWDHDLAFEGLSWELALPVFDWPMNRPGRGLYATLGYFSVKEIEINSDDGWLGALQIGSEVPVGVDGRASLVAAYFHYENITGIRNAPGSTLTDFTAPASLQRGNTLFDIRNDLDPATNLFALAGEYRLVNVTASYSYDFPGGQRLGVRGDYVTNVGFDEDDVFARTGFLLDNRTEGYTIYLQLTAPSLERASGIPVLAGDWAVNTGYRYLQRDAVPDAFTSSDFALGGTDTQGYVLSIMYAPVDDSVLRLRWFSSNEIDGPPLGIDTVQFDLLSRF